MKKIALMGLMTVAAISLGVLCGGSDGSNLSQTKDADYFLDASSQRGTAHPALDRMARLEEPYVTTNICPFECCGFGKWIARRQIKVYKDEGRDDEAEFILKPREAFRAVTGNLHVDPLGIVEVTESGDGYTKGEMVYILAYKGEGLYRVWHKGRIHGAVCFWGAKTNDSPRGKLKQIPRMVWWVKIKNKEGLEGWIRFTASSVGGWQDEGGVDGRDGCS